MVRLRGIVVGLGVMGSHHLRILSSMPGVEVVAIVDPAEPQRARAAAVAPGASAFGTFAEALDATRPDFACLAAPAAQLAGLAHEGLNAGLALMVEKPLAETEQDALQLSRDAERRGLALAVGYVERFNPAVTALKEKLDAGLIGRIYQVHARRLSPAPLRESMAGVSVDLATHDIDVMRHLVGREVERVFAESAQRTYHEAEDLICATLRFEGGATALLEVNWLTPTKVRQLSVTGERGMLVVDYLTQDLSFYENPRRATEWNVLVKLRGPDEGDMVRYALKRREPLLVEWESFLATLRNGEEPAVTATDAVAALSTAKAIQRSGITHDVCVPAYREGVLA